MISPKYCKSLVAASILASFSHGSIATQLTPIETVQDTWTNDTNKTQINGATGVLRIDTNKMRAFIQFNITDIPAGEVVESATLTMVAAKNKVTIPDTYIASVTGDWDEAKLNADTDDHLVWGATLASATNIAPLATVEFDVTKGIAGNGLYTFGVNMKDKDARSIKWQTKNAGVIPTLTIKTKAVASSDSNAPVFSDTATIAIDASGPLTDINTKMSVKAIDDIDGEITAQISAIDGISGGNTALVSGAHTITMTATDAAGNSASKDVTVHIKPFLTISQDASVAPGKDTTVTVSLSGPAAVYPVDIDYSVSGSAAVNQTGQLVFEDAKPKTLDVAIISSAQANESATLTLTNADNAQLPSSPSVTLTVVAGNTAPIVGLTFSQGGQTLSNIDAKSHHAITYIDATGGLVTVTANIRDINDKDLHDVDWGISENAFSASGESFTFDPAALSGPYTINVQALENNTPESLSSSLGVGVIVAPSLPPLSAESDSDNDGKKDLDEGYLDSDGDGIVDYLDNSDDRSQLPIGLNQQPLQTLNTLELSLGTIAAAARGILASSATLTPEELVQYTTDDSGTPLNNTTDEGYAAIKGATLINFTVSGLNHGGVASVVYPLADGMVITEQTKYRKYTQENGWTTFVSDSDNSISSAAKDAQGSCPAPLSELYTDGLTAGANCIELQIVDGGIYDADGLENGRVEDPGLLAEFNQAPTLAQNIVLADASVSVAYTANIAAQANDAGGDTLTFTKVNGPDWLTISSGGELSGTPGQSAKSSNIITVSVSDSKGGVAQETMSLAVNVAPIFKTEVITLDSAFQNVAYSANIAVQATDTQGNVITYSKLNGPYWLKLSPLGELSGTPLHADIGQFDITVSVTNASGATSTAKMTITIEAEEEESLAGSLSIGLMTLLGLVSLRRRKA